MSITVRDFTDLAISRDTIMKIPLLNPGIKALGVYNFKLFEPPAGRAYPG